MAEVAAGENKARNKMNKKRTGRFDNDRDANSQTKKRTMMNKDFHGNKKHGVGPRRNDEAGMKKKKKKIKKPKHLKRKYEQLMEQQGESSNVVGNVEKEKLKIEQQMKKLQDRKEKRAAAFERKVREMAGDSFDEETFAALREKGASLETILQATGAKKESSSKEQSMESTSSKKEKKNKRRKIDDTNEDTETKSSSKETTATNKTREKSKDDYDDTKHTSIAQPGGDGDGGDNEQEGKKKKENKKDKKKKTSKDNDELDPEKEQAEAGHNEEASPPRDAKDADKKEDEEGKATSDAKNDNDDTNESPFRKTRQNKKEWDKRYCVGRKPVTDFPIGSKHDGKVVYMKPYGIFIDIGCHSDAFCHISRIQDEYIESIEQIGYNVGDTIHNVRVVEIDRHKKRITVSLQSDKMREEELKSINDRKLRQQKRGTKNNKTNNRKWKPALVYYFAKETCMYRVRTRYKDEKPLASIRIVWNSDTVAKRYLCDL